MGPRQIAARAQRGQRTITPPTSQSPGLHHRRIGDIRVPVISDGFLEDNLEILKTIAQDEVWQLLTGKYAPAGAPAVFQAADTGLDPEFNQFALRQRGCPGLPVLEASGRHAK